MKQRQLIKVVAVSVTGIDGGRLVSTTGRGIVALRRGQTVLDFVTNFLGDRGITQFALHQRGESTWATSPIMFLDQEPKKVFTFTFITFPSSDLGFHAKDLAYHEIERDMKQLKKFVDG